MAYRAMGGRPPSTSSVTQRFEKFRGVDFANDPSQVDPSRSPWAVNVVSDLGGYPEKRKGWQKLYDVGDSGRVNGLYFFVDNGGLTHFLAHIGCNLYDWSDRQEPLEPYVIFDDMNDERSTSIVHGGKLYILDGANYMVYDGERLEDVEDIAFVPTTVTGCEPTGGGTDLEGANFLQPKQINAFAADGTATVYHVTAKELDDVLVNASVDNVAKVEGTDFNVNRATGEVTFTTAPPVYVGGSGIDNVYITFSKSVNTVITTKTFKGEVSKKVFALDQKQLDRVPLTVTVSSIAKVEGTDYQVDREQGTVTFATAPAIVAAGGADNVSITFSKTSDGLKTLETFTGDGIKKDYIIPTGIPRGARVYIRMNNFIQTEGKEFMVDRKNATVSFASAPPIPSTAGQKNVSIMVVECYRANTIKKCRFATHYGFGNANRIFVSGNPDQKNFDWQSGLDDPTYFPDTGYTKVGSDSTAIMGYLKQYENLLVIKEDNQQDTGIYMRTAQMNEQSEVIFPLKQGISGVGAISRGSFATLQDDPLFLTRQNISAISLAGSVAQERTVEDRSFFINTRLRQEKNLSEAQAVIWNGYYVLCVNGHCYVADGRQKSAFQESFCYEWYYWTNVPARVFMEYNDELYFGTEDGRICKFATVSTSNAYIDDTEPVGGKDGACWSTPFLDGGSYMMYKTINRRGTGILAKPYTHSSGKVYYASEREFAQWVKDYSMDVFDFSDMDFERFTFNTLDRPQVIVTNAKAKKVLMFQMIIKNDKEYEGFGVLGVTISYTMGGVVR